MTFNTMRSEEARQSWGTILENALRGTATIIERYSRPAAVIIGPDQWARFQELELRFAQQEFERQFAEIEAGDCPPTMTLEDLEEFDREIAAQS